MSYQVIITYILPLFLIPLSAVITQARFLDFGINANLFIAVISAYVFFIGNRQVFILSSLLGVLILKFKPAFESVSLSLVITIMFIFLMRKILPIFPFVSVILISFMSTALFYLFTNYHFVIDGTYVLFFESLYNSILSVLFYLFLKLIYEEER